MLRVSIIDDEPKIIDYFRSVTLQTKDVVCLRTAGSVEEYLKLEDQYKEKQFLFLDIYLKEKSSIQYIPSLLEKNPFLEIIMYTVNEEFHHLINSLKLGASGYVVKTMKPEDLTSFFDVLKKDGAAISAQMARKLVKTIQKPTISDQSEVKLNLKEKQILSFLAEGWTYEYIAGKMNLSVDSIRYYIKKIYKKLKVNSRAEAIRIMQDLF